MTESEKRKHRRLPIMFALSCRKVGLTKGELYAGRTLNVSTGGLYFETSTDAFRPGCLVDVKLAIPPTAGLLELGGRMSGFGRVLRADELGRPNEGRGTSAGRYGVAVEFCQTPRLCT